MNPNEAQSKAIFEKAKAAHKASGPHKTALDAIKSPTFGAMHAARKQLNKSKKI